MEVLHRTENLYDNDIYRNKKDAIEAAEADMLTLVVSGYASPPVSAGTGSYELVLREDRNFPFRNIIVARALTFALDRVRAAKSEKWNTWLVQFTHKEHVQRTGRNAGHRLRYSPDSMQMATTLLTVPFEIARYHFSTISMVMDFVGSRIYKLGIDRFAAWEEYDVLLTFDAQFQDSREEIEKMLVDENNTSRLIPKLLSRGRLDTIIYLCMVLKWSDVHKIVTFLIKNVTKTRKLVHSLCHNQIAFFNEYFEFTGINRLYFPNTTIDPRMRVLIPRNSAEQLEMEKLVRDEKYSVLL